MKTLITALSIATLTSCFRDAKGPQYARDTTVETLPSGTIEICYLRKEWRMQGDTQCEIMYMKSPRLGCNLIFPGNPLMDYHDADCNGTPETIRIRHGYWGQGNTRSISNLSFAEQDVHKHNWNKAMGDLDIEQRIREAEW